jgi:CubicO group peptidase (beta-lactamase class C family)
MWLLPLLLCAATLGAASVGTMAPLDERVDRLFIAVNSSTPGCVVGVIRSGELSLTRAYGSANLELGIPLKTDSVLPIASMSKQFTAMAIILLVEDGKLALNDDVEKYVPELPSYGRTITIANLLHHTSGLKDFDQLLKFSGAHSPFDLLTKEMVWDAILRQDGVNFQAGDEYSYSDTNYFLLAAIVERVSGQSLARFAQERIFGPLGMRHTEFRTNAGTIIAGAVSGYRKLAGAFSLAPDDSEDLGDSGVYTTVEDLARWDRNFYDGAVGGRRGVELMLNRTALNDGTLNAYAAGLKVQPYRGLTMVEHAGDLPGYQSELVRFPDERFSAVVLCNQRGGIDATSLALSVARIYLDAEFVAARRPPSAATLSIVPPNVAPPVSSYTGTYWDDETGNVLKLALTGGVLTVVDPSDVEVGPLERTASRTFRRGGSSYTFSGLDEVRIAAASGQPERFVRVAEEPVGTPTVDFAGVFESPDLDASWTFRADAGKLVLRRKGFAEETLEGPVFRDTFDSDLALLHFTRDASGTVTGLDALNYRLRKVHFSRVRP